ncbi:insulinase family protein [Undibacterium sp. Jales W-56]|uniref:M16 family metallopeptidase n=1 Tax=Undibacterium sp. Jales W-56 TaxID=2897325 RepID=UPI0021D23802|nr:pitrilysin family protein [Undibacterium sp. Jales W-56]MCU6434402.1 insulinase family protein [Undibacterium sp. Jales W-56]
MTPSRLQLSALSFSIAVAFMSAGPAVMAVESAAPAVAKSANVPAGLSLVHEVEGIKEYLMPNGLRVLLVPDASKPTTTVNITYRVGSRHENYGETGMAHLLEHLMFKGSKAHPRLWEELAQRGVNFNGTTWLDRTNYYETFAAKPETLAWAIAMEADRMVNSRISGADLKTEFSVVRNEMEKNENSPTSVLMQRVLSAAHQWHNYGKDTIGARSDVENVSIPHLQAFWRKYYQPDNAVLIVAGAFDHQATLKLISQHFGKIPKPTRVIEPTYTLDPAQDGERDVVVRRTGESPSVIALYHTMPAAHPDYAATEALAVILGDSPNGRLYKTLVESKKAAEVFPWAANLEEPGFMLLGANLRSEQNLDEAKKILIETIEGVAQDPVTADELKRAKANLENNLAQVFNDPEKFAVSLSDSIGNGDWRLFFLYRDRMRALTLDDVQRVATTWLKPSNRTTGRFIPEAQAVRAPAPAKVVLAEQINTFKPGVAMAQAENFVSTPDNIDKRTQNGALSNGLKYALLPKTTRGNTVVLNMEINLGDESSLQGKANDASLACAMLSRGTETLSHRQFSEQLDQLKAKLQISGTVSAATITLETTRENLARALELVRDALRKPAFGEAEFTQLITAQLAQLEESRKDPQAIAIDMARKATNTWPAGDARYYRSIEEKIAQLKAAKLADAKAFWQAFYGANHAQLAIVGDFDATAIKAQLQRDFGDWQAKQPFTRLTKPFVAVQPAALSQITPDKANAFFFGTLNLPVSDRHPDYAALTLGNYLLGGSANSRILERIRQKDGISYGGGSFIDVSPIDEAGSFAVGAIFAPQNRAKLETGLREEIARVLKDGFSTAELAEGKKSLIQQAQLNRSQDAGLAQTLAYNLYLGRTMQFDATLEKKIMALTNADVKAVLNKYLGYDKMLTVVAGDFK